MNRRFLLYTFVCCMFATMAVSCGNDDDVVSDNGNVALSSDVAITAFNLVDDKDILANLDSVFFTIDLKKAEIYNADSLPKGTDISRLRVEMSYPTCYSVEVSISGAERMVDTTFAYTSSDTIDFTGKVSVKLTAADQVTTRTYNVKVNVHEMESDSLQWNRLARRDLPSLYNNVTQQKTVKFDDDVYCLMRDNGSYVLAAADAPDASWSSEAVEYPFTPDIVSFTATDDAFYIISADNGELYTSQDARNWNSCGVYWASVSGVYNNRLLGVAVTDDSRYMLDEYPRRAAFVPTEAEEGFPVRGTSNMVMYRSEWGTNDIGIIIGGVMASGERTGRSWGYDGDNWSQLGNNDIGPHEGMMLLNYTTFDVSTENWTATPRPTLLALGGYVKDGEADNTLYVSRNYGVTWTVGDSLIQLPDYIPDVAYADALVFNTTMIDNNAKSRGDNVVWKSHPSRELPVWYMSIDLMSLTTGDGLKPVESWEVPYIYIFGGYTRNGNISNSIWKGVINRLAFKPIY